jgi:hypothetical protein
MTEKLVNDWEIKKKKLKDPNAIGLVTVDGHSTRFQSEIWNILINHALIVVCKFSYILNIISALDSASNGKFKYHMEEVPPFPKKSDISRKLPAFVEAVARAAFKALDPSTIKAGIFFFLFFFFFRFLQSFYY